jgi:hypothetical protein
MKYITRFGKSIEISTDQFFTMSDDELERLEETLGAPSDSDFEEFTSNDES